MDIYKNMNDLLLGSTMMDISDIFDTPPVEVYPKSLPTEPVAATEEFKMDTPVKNEEVPTEVDENGNVQTLPKPMLIQARCPITISSVSDSSGGIHMVVDAHIRGPIDDIDGYIPLINALNAADSNCIFNIHIQSGGGMVTTGATIASAIAACKGTVNTIAEGLCASAASLIWSAGHNCIVGDYAMFMYHMSSHADMNNSQYIEESARQMVQYVRKCLMRNALAQGHITQDDYVKFCENKDEVWISAKDMRTRIENHKATMSGGTN